MKLILPLTFLWSLLSSAAALQCLTCSGATCISAASSSCASSDQQCLTASVQGASAGQGVLKGCAPASVCPASGNQNYSLSSTVFSASINAQCCNTDNCNVATPSPPTFQSVNNLQCYSCDATNLDCSIRIQCKGAEDRCFRVNVTTGTSVQPFLGCASASVCAASSVLPGLLSLSGLSAMSCCQNSLCNSAPAVATAAHLLLAPLAFSLYWD